MTVVCARSRARAKAEGRERKMAARGDLGLTGNQKVPAGTVLHADLQPRCSASEVFRTVFSSRPSLFPRETSDPRLKPCVREQRVALFVAVGTSPGGVFSKTHIQLNGGPHSVLMLFLSSFIFH